LSDEGEAGLERGPIEGPGGGDDVDGVPRTKEERLLPAHGRLHSTGSVARTGLRRSQGGKRPKPFSPALRGLLSGALEHGREEGIGAVAVGCADEEPVLDALRAEPPGAGGDKPEVRPLEQEAGDKILVLGTVHGARGVDEHAAGADPVCSLGQELALEGEELGENGGGLQETQVGPPAQGAQLGAWGIHEDTVHGQARGRRAEHVDVREPRAGTALQEPVEALGIRIVGQEPASVLHGGAKLERLASGAGTEVEHGLAGTGLHEQAQQLAALVLDLEEALLKGRKTIEVGPRPLDDEGQGAPGAGAGLDALGAQPLGERVAGGTQGVHPERDGAWDIEVGTEVLGFGPPLLGEVVGEPIWEGGSEGERWRFSGDQLWGSLHPRERGSFAPGHTGEPVEESEEERLSGGIRATQEVAKAAPPEGDIEEGLLEGLALLAGEVAVIPEGAIQNPLGGGSSEDAGEGLDCYRRESREGGPRLDAQAGERIKPDC
jgi:hypothetical protein